MGLCLRGAEGFAQPHTPHGKQGLAPVPADFDIVTAELSAPQKTFNTVVPKPEASQLKRNHGSQDSQNW